MIKRFTPNPVLVIVDAKPKDLGLPTEAYYAVDEIHDVFSPFLCFLCSFLLFTPPPCSSIPFPPPIFSQDGTKTTRTFHHLPTTIGAEEAEEIGVEHLLRDIKDNG